MRLSWPPALQKRVQQPPPGGVPEMKHPSKEPMLLALEIGIQLLADALHKSRTDVGVVPWHWQKPRFELGQQYLRDARQ